MTHFEFHYHIIAFFNTLEVHRLAPLAIAKSNASLKHGNPVAAPVPAYLDAGEERFLGDVLYTRKTAQKLNYYAAGQPGTGLGLIPIYALRGDGCELVAGPASLKENRNLHTYCPVDESEPDAKAFAKEECKRHGNKEETGAITPCKPEELPSACKRTIENLKKETVVTTLSERFAPKLVLKQSKCGDYETGVYKSSTFKAVTGQHPRLILDRVQNYLLSNMPKESAETEDEGIERRKQRIKLVETDRISALAIVAIAWRMVVSTAATVRDTRDGAKQIRFENNCADAKLLKIASAKGDRYEYVNRQPALTLSSDLGTNDGDYFVQAKRAAKIREQLERSNPPKPEFERLITEGEDNLFGVELQWVPRIGPLTEDEAVAWSQYRAEDYVYTVWVPKMTKTNAVRRLRECPCPWHASLPNLFADKVDDMHARIQASRELTAKNVLLDPLRQISNWTAAVEKDTKVQVKERKYYYTCKERALYAGSLPDNFTKVDRIKGQRCESVSINKWTLNRMRINKWTLDRMQSSVHDLNLSEDLGLRYTYTEKVWRLEVVSESERYVGRVPMADCMGAFYNVVDGVWQQFRKGWQTHATCTTELQWTGWEKWLRTKYGITSGRWTLGEAERLQELKHWMTAQTKAWAVPVVSLRNNAWERYDKGVWEVAGETSMLLDSHTSSAVMESFKFAGSCVCRFCRNAAGYCTERFTSYTEMQNHEKECHPDELVKRNCVPLSSSNGAAAASECLLKVKHSTYGNVLYIRTIWDEQSGSDNRYAWVLHRKEYKKVNVSDLTVDGNTFVPPVARYYAGMEVSTKREYDDMLDYFLSVVYAEGLTYEKAMKHFRDNRVEVLSRNTYLFCDEIVGRSKPERHIDKYIDIYPAVTEHGTNWYLRIYPRSRRLPCVLALGKVGSRDSECLTVYKALKHCRAKEAEAKRLMKKKGVSKAEAEAEWLKWAVYTQVCHEAKGSWATNNPKSLDVLPFITCMEEAASAGDEMDYNSGDDEADALIASLNSTGAEEHKGELKKRDEALKEKLEAGDKVPETRVDELVPGEEDESEPEENLPEEEGASNGDTE